ncbi:hypothetical protein A3Q56_04023 [Intoshia linei]|uniref:Uncharacterized protein n=1 Tax=Intoshia linei TaxID=1819745 RepID=A0A177B3P5_9BILA|nr:hypothetical protein A3Q56_04023 [Intoshia linei]
MNGFDCEYPKFDRRTKTVNDALDDISIFERYANAVTSGKKQKFITDTLNYFSLTLVPYILEMSMLGLDMYKLYMNQCYDDVSKKFNIDCTSSDVGNMNNVTEINKDNGSSETKSNNNINNGIKNNQVDKNDENVIINGNIDESNVNTTQEDDENIQLKNNNFYNHTPIIYNVVKSDSYKTIFFCVLVVLFSFIIFGAILLIIVHFKISKKPLHKKRYSRRFELLDGKTNVTKMKKIMECLIQKSNENIDIEK